MRLKLCLLEIDFLLTICWSERKAGHLNGVIVLEVNFVSYRLTLT